MGKPRMIARIPIVGTGALVGCIGELLQLPLHVSLILAVTSQFVLTVGWLCINPSR
jgi:hypothetical protein